jgi:hypothetical protein
MKWCCSLFFLAVFNWSFSQSLKENDYLYFLGSYGLEDSSIQVGLYITVKENNFIELKIQVAKNWETIGEKVFLLHVVEQSLNKNKFKIKHLKQNYLAYKYINNEGVELLILKNDHRLAKLIIPPNLIFGVKTPEIFHQK